MTNKELAEHLARKLFECGCEGGRTVTRIEFKTGDWRIKETALGGLGEKPCAEFFETVLDELDNR